MRTKSFLIALVAMMLPMVVSAQNVEIDGICYGIRSWERTAIVAYKESCYSGHVVIPDSINYNGIFYIVNTIGGGGNKSGTPGAFGFPSPELTAISIPKSIKYIGNGAFGGCSSLKAIYISDLAAWCDIDYGYTDYGNITYYSNPLMIAHDLFLNNKLITDLVIPENVTEIKPFAFAGSHISSVSFHKDFKSLGLYAFYNCENLKDIYCYCPIIGLSQFTSSEDMTLSENMTLHIRKRYESAYKSWPGKIEYIDGIDFTITYYVDGEEYQQQILEVGESVTPASLPEKEGYTFSGWSDIPETMPANDVVVNGTFTKNKYKLTYKIDGDVYKSYDIKPGSTLIPEAEPTKEGYNFSGWSEIPEEMPAEDVVVTGTFAKIVTKLSDPTIDIVKGEVVFSHDEDNVTYNYEIALQDNKGTGGHVNLTKSYKVSVYASKEGYKDSDAVSKVITVKKGDLNLDGKIDAADHVELTNIIMEIQEDGSGTE